MNKSRRMINLQAQRLSLMGYAVMIIDLFGTGDSSGDFADATWEIWRENLHQAWQWLKEEQQISKIHLWGIRLGCLLALDTAQSCQLPVASYLLWQPVTNGERYVNQLLRLRMAEHFGQQTSETVATLREYSAAGEILEIAGYQMNSRLLQTINQLKGDMFSLAPGSKTIWLECSLGDPAEILPGSQRLLDVWREQDTQVHSAVVTGPSFWSSVEIEEVSTLIEQTCNLFAEANDVVL